MIQFDDIIFLNWIGSTINSIYLDVFQLLMDFWGMVGLPHFSPRLLGPGGSLEESSYMVHVDIEYQYYFTTLLEIYDIYIFIHIFYSYIYIFILFYWIRFYIKAIQHC